jgi:hypothetical protein
MRATMFVVVTVATVCAAGCASGSSAPKRGRISGAVTLDGKPAAAALIRFIALESGGINVLATVRAGTYDVPEGQGPTKGKYRVEFSVPSNLPQRVANPDQPGAWMEERTETLPPRYHRDSTLILEYDPNDPKPFSADLMSR